MKVVSKIVAGYGFLAVLMATLLLYVVSQIEYSRITVPFIVQISKVITAILIVAVFLWSIWSIRVFSKRIQETQGITSASAASRVDEFTPLIEEFNRLSRTADEIENAKKEFFSYAAHELKGPLASLQESIQLLLDPACGPITSKQRRLLEIQLNACKRLFAMLSDLADLARMETGALEYFVTDQEVTVLIEQLITEYESRLQERKVTPQLELQAKPISIRVDAARVRQAITKLVDNALKFSPTGTPIQIGVRFSNELPITIPQHARHSMAKTLVSQGFVIITIADRGCGVPDSEKKKIFEKFYQVKSKSQTSNKGLGIGLTLCRLIAEAHQGSVWVEDNPGGGSRFVLIFPKNLAPATIST